MLTYILFVLLFTAIATAIGVATRWLVHPIYEHRRNGAQRLAKAVFLVGLVVTSALYAASLALYHDVYGFASLTSPFLPLERSSILDVITFLLFLPYVIFYRLGARLVEQRLRLGFPAMGEPILLPEGKSLIALADTHIGLSPNVLFRKRGPKWDRYPLGTFFDWLKTFSGSGSSEGSALTEVHVWDETKGVVMAPFRVPEYTVLLGDILELWDAPDMHVEMGMATIFSTFNQLPGQVLYVLGNHDQILAREAGDSPALGGATEVVPDVWPGPVKSESDIGILRPVRTGGRDYLFLHGHQFDAAFQFLGRLAFIPAHLRRAARPGQYLNVFFWLFSVALLLSVIGVFGGEEVLAGLVIVALFLFAFPIFYMLYGRAAYRFFTGHRYRPGRALKGFIRWWTIRAGEGRPVEGSTANVEDLAIVFGHTHEANVVDGERMRSVYEVKGAERERPLPLLLNVPSWVDDPRHPIERSIFLYLDEEGYRFYGWDWGGLEGGVHPFHIPTAMVRALRDGIPLDKALDLAGIGDERTLSKLGWPPKFTEKWKIGKFHGVPELPPEAHARRLPE